MFITKFYFYPFAVQKGQTRQHIFHVYVLPHLVLVCSSAHFNVTMSYFKSFNIVHYRQADIISSFSKVAFT